ncbi:MAG: Ig-like domain-containing protein, partial [Gammaproteobacteria bacterium]
MPYWALAIAMGMASQAASAARCDVDADGDIDRIDIVSIRQALGTPASGGNDPRDADGNGRILRNDELLCARRCTLPLCDVVSPPDAPAVPPNMPPLARRQAARMAENTAGRINLIANDRDPDGRLVAKSVKIVARPRHGRVRNHKNGTVTYTPASGFTGRDRFRYRVRDDDEAPSRAARVRLIVQRGNHPPLADAGSDTNTATGLPVTLNGSGSSDPDGDALAFLWRFLSVPPPSTVTDAVLANGNTAAPRFTPDVDGPYELALEVSDGAMSDVDTVIVTARAANVPPNANAGPDTSAVAGQVVNLDGRGSTDPDNGPAPLGFRWSFAALPPGSLLSDIDIAGATTALASFTPDFAGDYRISLDVNDGADTGRDEVLISAALPNVAPNADAGADLVVQLGAGATLNGVASNDPDNGPTPLSFQWAFVSVPVGSVLTDADLSGATTAAPSFTPDIAGFYVLRIEVSDGDLTDTDQVMVKANVAPVAVDDPRTLVENTSLTDPAPGVLSNDTDGNNDVLTAVLDSGPSDGTLNLNADGSFTYTPDADFEGTDGFTYHANDGSADSNLATVTITVTHANEPPVAVDDAYTTDEDTPLVVAVVPGVLGNDSDFESDPLTAIVDTVPANGTLTLNPDGSLTYTPNADFNGTDSFTYHANDGSSDSNLATVTLTIDPVNDAPAFTAGPNQTVLEGAGAQTVDPWATGISPGPANESSQTV